MKNERTGEITMTMEKPANDNLDLIVGNGNKKDSRVAILGREDPALRRADFLPEKSR